MPRVLVLNGGSGSGKSTLARELQGLLDGYWMRLGVDTLIDAAPPRLLSDPDGLRLADDGTVQVGPEFATLFGQWMVGVAAMAAAGANVIIEDNFLGGRSAQQGWRDVLGDLPVGWIGVRCPAEIVAAREQARGDRISGMAALQAESVHHGIDYDLEIDTGTTTPDRLAVLVRDHFFC